MFANARAACTEIVRKTGSDQYAVHLSVSGASLKLLTVAMPAAVATTATGIISYVGSPTALAVFYLWMDRMRLQHSQRRQIPKLHLKSHHIPKPRPVHLQLQTLESRNAFPPWLRSRRKQSKHSRHAPPKSKAGSLHSRSMLQIQPRSRQPRRQMEQKA